jgi:hypothetical protein
VRAARLDHTGDFAGFGLDRDSQMVESRQQLPRQLERRGDVDCRRDRIVAALAHVDVIVGVHGRAERSRRKPRNDLVCVHVGARAGARLEHVDREVLRVHTVCDLERARLDGRGDGVRQQSQAAIGAGRRPLDERQSTDERRRHSQTADRKIVDCPLRLRTP